MRSATTTSLLAMVLVVTVLLATSLAVAFDLSPSGPRSSTETPTWDMAVDVMTQPDDGTFDGRTVRFSGPTVTYRIADDFPANYEIVIHDAFAVAAGATGLTVVETTGPADIVIVAKDGHDAYTTIWSRGGGLIDRSVVQLGCCRARPAYEDILQSFGPIGDHAASGSIFSEDLSLDRPSDWDLCVLRMLYTFPPATTASELRSTTACD